MRVTTIYFKTSCIKLYNYVLQRVRSRICGYAPRTNIDKKSK